MIREIAGRNNQSIKLAAKLQKKKHRRERGLFVTEGFDLLDAALAAGEEPLEVLVRTDLLDRLPGELREDAEEDDLDIGVCPPEVLERASGLGGAADVIAVFQTSDPSLADIPLEVGVSVYLAGVGDPGNVGTITRSAAVFGAGGVMLAPGSADPHSPKALRAGMGAHFHLPVVPEVRPEDLVAKLKAQSRRTGAGITLVLADPSGGVPLRDAHVEGAVVLVLGEERGGLEGFPTEAGSGVRTIRVSIPQVAFDSLNVAMAATIFLYELTDVTSEGRSRSA